MRRSRKIRLGLFLVAALSVVGVLAWSSDTITLQDEWTIYMARCRDGTWHGQHCSGQLVAAERHHFVADKPKGEVAFDVVGMAGSSGSLSQCVVDDGRKGILRIRSMTPATLDGSASDSGGGCA